MSRPERREHPAGFAGFRALKRLLLAKAESLPRVLVINGHPDPRPERYCAALCSEYASGGSDSGLQTEILTLGNIPSLATDYFPHNSPPHDLLRAFDLIAWATQLAVVFPLWLDNPPLPVQQLFARRASLAATRMQQHVALKACLIVTMGMPAFTYRSPTCPSVRQLSLAGIETTASTFIGCVDSLTPAQRKFWLAAARQMGRDALSSSHSICAA